MEKATGPNHLQLRSEVTPNHLWPQDHALQGRLTGEGDCLHQDPRCWNAPLHSRKMIQNPKVSPPFLLGKQKNI